MSISRWLKVVLVKDTNFGTHIDTKIRPMAIVNEEVLVKGTKVEGYVFTTQPNGIGKKILQKEDTQNFDFPIDKTAFVSLTKLSAKFYAELKGAKFRIQE